MSVRDRLEELNDLTNMKKSKVIHNKDMSINQKILRFSTIYKNYCKGVNNILMGVGVENGS